MDVKTGETGTPGTGSRDINGMTLEQVFNDGVARRVEQLARADGKKNITYVRSTIKTDDPMHPEANWNVAQRLTSEQADKQKRRKVSASPVMSNEAKNNIVRVAGAISPQGIKQLVDGVKDIVNAAATKSTKSKAETKVTATIIKKAELPNPNEQIGDPKVPKRDLAEVVTGVQIDADSKVVRVVPIVSPAYGMAAIAEPMLQNTSIYGEVGYS
jgi:hypothetical protein